MAWAFYSKEGKLQYDLVSSSAGNATTLDGVDSTGFVRIGSPGLNTGNVDIDGSVTLPLNIFAADTTLNDTHRTVLVNSAAAPRTITLPAAPLTGQLYEIRDVGSTGAGASGTNNITIARNGNTIDGNAANLVLNANGAGVTLVWDGFKWVSLSTRYIAPGTINADTLDSLDSTQFVRKDIDQTVAGNLTFSQANYSPVNTFTNSTNPNLLSDVHRTVGVNTTAATGNVTITLPSTGAGDVVGQWYEIYDYTGNAATNNIIISPGTDLLNGVNASITLNTAYDSVIIVKTTSTNWNIVAWRFPPAGPITTTFNDLTDVTLTAPAEGQTVRYDTPANQWVNTSSLIVTDQGVAKIKATGTNSGLILGEDLGAGLESTINHHAANTIRILGRTIQAGTPNDSAGYLQNGAFPATGANYTADPPNDNTLIVKSSFGDMFVRLPSNANVNSLPMDGDTLVIKDGEGFIGVNVVEIVAEGVRYRNLPQLTLDTPTGSIGSSISTPTEGGPGVDEIQTFQVSGSGTYKINFAGSITAATLTETSNAAAVQSAINSLSPHPTYGYFTVSVSGTTAGAGLQVTFNGGATIDGSSSFALPTPWSACKLIYKSTASGGNWLII